jgi:hypothetical protein
VLRVLELMQVALVVQPVVVVLMVGLALVLVRWQQGGVLLRLQALQLQQEQGVLHHANGPDQLARMVVMLGLQVLQVEQEREGEQVEQVPGVLLQPAEFSAAGPAALAQHLAVLLPGPLVLVLQGAGCAEVAHSWAHVGTHEQHGVLVLQVVG